MKRELKFRAYKRGKMYNDIGLHPHICMDHTKQDEDDIYFVNPKTTDTGHLTLWNSDDAIMQFTGLQDKNEKDIYEGDIIDINCYMGKIGEFEDKKCKVIFKDAKFQCEPIDSYFKCYELHRACEVLGNIHEHSHLLS